MKVSAQKISEWYATRNRLGGSNMLTQREQDILMLAHHHHYGIMGTKRLSVGQVREFITWASVFGSAVEREAVRA